MKKSRGIIIVLLLVMPLTAALGLSWLEIDVGLLYLLNGDQDSGPSPLLTTLGASIPINRVSRPLVWNTGLHLFGVHYQYASDRATPAELEFADSLWTLGIMVDSTFGYRFAPGEKIGFGGAAGLAGVFRIPLFPVGGGAEFWGDTFKYFLSRFLYTEVMFFLDWAVREKLTLDFSLRILYPVFNLWGGGSLPFYDQLIIKGLIGFRIPLGLPAE